MNKAAKHVREFLSDESGQGTMEYILIVGLIVLFLIVALYIFRNALGNFINKVSAWLEGAEPEKLPGG